MRPLRIQDNQRPKGETYTPERARQECEVSNFIAFRDDLRAIAELNLSKEPSPGLLLFPQNFENFNDDRICWLSSDRDDSLTITTGNTLGFIGCNDTLLTISSRFANKNGENYKDYFLYYMLEKAGGLHIVDFQTLMDNVNVEEFLLYLLFVKQLQSALAKGLFKQYRYNEYNDANIRGVIDVARHIRVNIPFAGKVAYRTREHSYDNPVMHLIRHTIEVLKTKDFGRAVLSHDSDIKDCARKIIECTPTYAQRDRRKVIAANRRPVNHPYFTEYRNLQKLCLQILRHEGISTGNEQDKVYGILFDGAWLWEEYLDKVLASSGFDVRHPQNKAGSGGEYLFIDGQTIYPDFKIMDNKKVQFVADAKYKHEAKPQDYYQVITYMCRYLCKTGFIFKPNDTSSTEVSLDPHEIKNGTGDRVIELGLPVPQSADTFAEFRTAMTTNEKAFVMRIQETRSPPCP